jgi:MFS transporter, DHA1 family, multidrug resistance protein
MITPAKPASAVPGSVRASWVNRIIPVDYLLFHLGYFGVLPLLPLLVKSQLGPHSSVGLGAVLLVYNAAIGGACLPLAPLIARVGAKSGMAFGLACAAMGTGLFAYAHSIIVIAGVLLLAGTGMSVHGVIARSLIATVIPGDPERNRIFSTIQVAVNISAAVGPMVSTTLYAASGSRTLLAVASGCYLTALGLVLLKVPSGIRAATSVQRWPVSRCTLRAVAHDPDAVRTVLVSTAGGFLYAQFFSAVALLITLFVAKGPAQGLLFLEDAVVVVVAQVPVSAIVERKLRRGMLPSTAMRLGVLMFALSLLMLAFLLWAKTPVFLATFITIIVFAIAETVYTPIVNTAFGRIPAGSPIEAFNLYQIFVTLGQSSGALCGGAVFLTVADHGTGAIYWVILAGCGFLITAGSGSMLGLFIGRKEGINKDEC